MKMKKRFLLLPNENKDKDLSYTGSLANFLRENGQTVYTYPNLHRELADCTELYSDDGGADVAVVIGGDGTILRWAHKLMGQKVPILGINFGRLGYLAEVEPGAAKEALMQIITDKYKVENRMVLHGILQIGDNEPRGIFACNDLVIHRGEMSGMLPVRAYINETYMDTFLSDGVIAATPSGSTAYNFSAGGPIVNPTAENILFTPICSHSVLGRSIIADGTDLFRFEIEAGDQEDYPVLSVDGVEKILLNNSSSLVVQKSEYKFHLIRVTDMSFYEILHKKMFV